MADARDRYAALSMANVDRMIRTVSQCNPSYGECGSDLSPAIKASLTLTDDNTCGRQVNKVCPPGSCCSHDNQCGTTTAHCGIGCQNPFGICKPPITKLPPPGPVHPKHEYRDEALISCATSGHMALAFEGDGDDLSAGDVDDSGEKALANFDQTISFYLGWYRVRDFKKLA
ncbi:hypothetical protein BSLG_005623 [Batrachochytrium salamandrivorans]|nr:hypothetical protein BSLG_005623 [Batrachochytrium salamandrivorans]